MVKEIGGQTGAALTERKVGVWSCGKATVLTKFTSCARRASLSRQTDWTGRVAAPDTLLVFAEEGLERICVQFSAIHCIQIIGGEGGGERPVVVLHRLA